MIVFKDTITADGGQYTLLLTNLAGTKTISYNVKVLDRPAQCEGPLNITGVTAEKCVLSWHPPQYDGGSSVTHYIIERRETSRLAWTVVTNNCTVNMFKVTKLLEGNEYIFRVMAVNRYGISEPLDSAQVIMKNPFVTPGSPHILEVSNITRDSMTVCWAPPDTDGGSEIIGYIIEKKDRSGIRWTRCNRQKVTDVCFRVTCLAEDHEYEFKVSAENAAGLGEPSLPSAYYKAYDPKFKPGPPTHVHVIDTTKSSISITWGKPVHDGGSAIQGYIVEICKAENEEWIMCTPPTGLRVNKFEIHKLIENQEYNIRVCAMNKIGVGELAAIPGTAKPEEKTEGPELSLDSELRKGIVVRAGGSVRINIPFRGRPSPDIGWSKDEAELSDKVLIEKGLNYTQLSIDGCDRNDTGKYTLKLENKSGSVSEFVSVKVLDTPVTGYIVEKRDLPEGRWVKSSFTNVIETEFTVSGLTQDQKYEFRVIARNAAGIFSEPSESTGPITATDEVEPPRVSIDPQYKDVIVINAGETLVLDADIYGKPVPDVTWAKDGKEIEKNTAKMEVKTTVKHTMLVVKDCNRNDNGHFELTLSNIGGTKTIPITVKVLDRPGPPSGPLQVTDVTANTFVSMRAGGTLRLFVTIRGRPVPNVKWEKEEGSLTEKTQVETTNSYTILTIDNVNRFDSGKYVLTLENNSGTKSAFVSVRILDSPSAPLNFVVKDITRDSVTLLWEQPLTDGGAKITNYIVEKRESVRKAYTAVTNNCTQNMFVISELQEGGIYYFRVRAVNEHGIGLAVETKDPVKVAQAPMPPGKVSVVDVTRNSVTLSWEKPSHDGGSKVICYNVEIQTKGSDKWNVSTTTKGLEATVTGLTSGEQHSFRIIAVNEKGKSEPKELGVPVITKDIQMEPTLNLLFTTYSVNAGKDLTIEVPFRGRPKPAVSWKKDGLPLRQTSSITLLTSEASSKISFKEATRDHVGKYEITLANTAGTKSVEIGVVVLDKPGSPTALKVDTVTSESITLSWNPPEYDGGCNINNYIVEKRDTITTVWETVSSAVARTSIKVSRLTHGSEYQFRVYAVNRYGKGPFVESSGITAQYQFKLPGPPATPQIAHVTKAFMFVTWNEPVNDGGSPVLGYHLERRERSSVLWIKMNRRLIKDTEFKVTGTEEGLFYEYRVYAENIAGIGKCSKTSELVAARDPCDPPGKPTITNITKTSVSLLWTKPEYDGGDIELKFTSKWIAFI
uniref:Titin n=1 Tax=Paramormyrops kingsleyae TaxID=1676925 RepID=A0A3B3QHM3_9TELE